MGVRAPASAPGSTGVAVIGSCASYQSMETSATLTLDVRSSQPVLDAATTRTASQYAGKVRVR